jgi:DMSO reductase anchor subunit
VFGVISAGQAVAAAWLTIVCALLTLCCTGMIYASLPTIRAWHQPLVVPIYIVLALGTGGVLLCVLLAGFGRDVRIATAVTATALAAGWILKARYWSMIDRPGRTHTAEAATGLGHLGTVRPLDPPHTQPNYVMREMGYQVARRHAAKLRRVAVALLFLMPLTLLLWLLVLPPFAQLILAIVAALSTAAGVLVERWLFFAEAEHVVVLYYRGGTA